ncbi:uncharacterized protein LOC143242784 isoform X1 [Tachypleus tridentatus]|uniref:uncharacterized protein LOC143242784 isoform X1 n=1 Tax=Tachypleus tridentatus TaxID=6853 RepID=UPI003FD63D38
MSPFFIQKGLEGLPGSPKLVKKLQSGDILVKTSTSPNSELLLHSKTIGNIPVEFTPHATLNSSRGVIVEMDLKMTPEPEILASFSTQGVSAMRRMSTRNDKLHCRPMSSFSHLRHHICLPPSRQVILIAEYSHTFQTISNVSSVIVA